VLVLLTAGGRAQLRGRKRFHRAAIVDHEPLKVERASDPVGHSSALAIERGCVRHGEDVVRLRPSAHSRQQLAETGPEVKSDGGRFPPLPRSTR
jgi:hypothetical protein